MSIEETPGLGEVTQKISEEQPAQAIPVTPDQTVSEIIPVIENLTPPQTTEVVQQRVPDSEKIIPKTGTQPEENNNKLLDEGYEAIGKILLENHPDKVVFYENKSLELKVYCSIIPQNTESKGFIILVSEYPGKIFTTQMVKNNSVLPLHRLSFNDNLLDGSFWKEGNKVYISPLQQELAKTEDQKNRMTDADNLIRDLLNLPQKGKAYISTERNALKGGKEIVNLIEIRDAMDGLDNEPDQMKYIEDTIQVLSKEALEIDKSKSKKVESLIEMRARAEDL